MVVRLKCFRVAGLVACLFTFAACGGGGGGGSTPAANAAPSFSGATSFTFAEDETVEFLLSIEDADSTTVTIAGVNGGDSGLFVLDANSGRLTANTSTGRFDFEMPQDSNGDNVYEQELELSDGVNTVRDTITVTITNVDEGPEFEQLDEVSLEEGFTGDLVTFSAIDPEGGSVGSYTIIEVSKLGEVVNSQRLLNAFSIDANTGQLSVVVPFDAEVDGTQDLISISVEASDGLVTATGSVSIRLVDLASQLVAGYRLSGLDSVNPLGGFASALGDVDADGVQEVWVSQETDESGLETAYLLWGEPIRQAQNGGDADQLLSVLDPADRIVVTHDNRSQTARRSQLRGNTAGDIDNDGFADVLVMPVETRDPSQVATGVDGDNAYLLWGSQLTTASLDLTSLTATAGVKLTGLPRQANLGMSASVGDFDGDSRSDLILALPALNRALVIFGDALAAAGGELNLATANSTAVVLIQSDLTAQALIQQVANNVLVIPDVSGDGIAELVIDGASHEPDLSNAVLVVEGALVAAAKGGAGVINLAADANDTSVLDMRIQDLSIASLAGGGDVDGDGSADLVVGHIGNGGETRVATLVYGATLAASFGTINDPDLNFTDSAVGLRIFLDNQIESQTIGVSVTTALAPSLGGGLGDELVVAIDEIDSIGRTLNGQILVFNDAALVGAVAGELRVDDTSFAAAAGRRLLGYASDARTGRSLFLLDADGDGTIDFGTASSSAGSDLVGTEVGGLVLVPGEIVVDAFGGSDGDVDLATSLISEN